MVRIGLISDIHGDVHALRIALRRLDAFGCNQILCAGDLIDYGSFPDETIDLLRERAIPCIRGNHDRWAVHVDRAGCVTDLSGWALLPRSLRFLAGLPQSLNLTIEGVRIAFHHARPGSDMAGVLPGEVTGSELRRLVEKAEADVLVVGHVHVPFVLPASGGGSVINPGSLLCNPAAEYQDTQPRAGTVGPSFSGGTFGVMELPSLHFTVYRVGTGEAVPL
jgi:putative phosphoesterase